MKDRADMEFEDRASTHERVEHASGKKIDASAGSTRNQAEPEKQGEVFIQGMCDIVSIRVDNLRPMQDPLTEQDFLDSEPGGDDDYNGHDVDIEDQVRRAEAAKRRRRR